MGRIRVVLAEDNVLLREGISRLIAANDDLELAGTAGDLPGLLALIEREKPEVVVTDIRMPPSGSDEGIQAAAWAREHHPATGVVVLSQYVAPGYALALLEQGSAGRAYLLKERVGSVDELANAIRTVAGGGSVIDPMVVDELVRSSGKDSRAALSALSTLTARELAILAEMAQGKSNAAIAATLFVTERAVEKHTNSIFAKLGLAEERDVNRRVKAVLLYLGDQRRPAQGG
jgi:DNA-binding NarL/FixJ family response regulator